MTVATSVTEISVPWQCQSASEHMRQEAAYQEAYRQVARQGLDILDDVITHSGERVALLTMGLLEGNATRRAYGPGGTITCATVAACDYWDMRAQQLTDTLWFIEERGRKLAYVETEGVHGR